MLFKRYNAILELKDTINLLVLIHFSFRRAKLLFHKYYIYIYILLYIQDYIFIIEALYNNDVHSSKSRVGIMLTRKSRVDIMLTYRKLGLGLALYSHVES